MKRVNENVSVEIKKILSYRIGIREKERNDQ